MVIMTLSTLKPTREERAAMTKDELLRTVWLLDDVLESLRWVPIKERQPKYYGEYEATVITLPGFKGISPGVVQNIRMVYVSGNWKSQWFQKIHYYQVLAWREVAEPFKG